MNSNYYADLLADNPRPSEDVLDVVYAKYANSNPFLPITHFIDHSTMGAEALVHLKLGSQVEEWISHHKVRPYDPPMSQVDIAKNWRAALGKPECHGDWLGFFEAELNERPYEVVLDEWVARFAHEIGTHLFHGLIRTAYVTRALGHKDTPARRDELARGLALWAIGVKTQPEPSAGGDSYSDVENEFLNLARAGAATFLNNPTVPNLHLITSAMAYSMVARYLDKSTHAVAIKSFKKTHATALKNFGALNAKAALTPVPLLGPHQIKNLAHKHDAHPAKLTEAALRAYLLSGDDIFLKAAGEVQRFPSLKGVARSLRFGILAKFGPSGQSPHP